MYKVKIKDNIREIVDGSGVTVARYIVNSHHWMEKDISVIEGCIDVQLCNGFSCVNCMVELNNDSIQMIP